MTDTKKDVFVIEGLGGERLLEGEIVVSGAKNAVLPAMAASLLFADEVTLTNMPEIEDVARMGELLEGVGVGVKRGRGEGKEKKSEEKTEEDGVLRLFAPENISSEIPVDISKRLRASVVLTGPLLARTGKVVFPHPGGCVIGARPIDIFLDGFQKMGAEVSEHDGPYEVRVKRREGKLIGADIFFRKYSVTATETFMMTAVLASGVTTLRNAALEPEIAHLADFLNQCGAKIQGAGTSTIQITGTGVLNAEGRVYVTPPDRIEAGSFVLLAAAAGKGVTISNCESEHISSLLEWLAASGVQFEIAKNSVRVFVSKKNTPLKPLEIKTHEYPGFPTDLQAPMVVFMTQCDGESTMFETIFEGRMEYVPDLKHMGADIVVWDANRIMVRGPIALKGRELASPDLRAGMAFVIAAVIADGESIIHNVYNIDRGYATIEERLRKIGVKIKRKKQ